LPLVKDPHMTEWMLNPGSCLRLCLIPLSLGLGTPSVADAQAPAEARAALEGLETAFTGIADSVSKSVVAIRIESRRKMVNPFGGFPFGELFGLPEGREQYQIQRGTGSGVVIRADGYILTNKHVVEGASRVDVVFKDGTQLHGKTVGIDDATDLAVVKVEPVAPLVPANFADSNKTKPGQWVVAIGSPFGLDYTVTVGVVSAVGRGGMGANEIEDYLQTDASINPGNSGGPLVNLRSEVLGINTMIVGQGTGIGFAIPSNLARIVSDQLITHGRVHRAYIGVGFQELTPELAAHFGVQGKGGALISSVVPESPAERAGLRAGDVITRVDAEPIRESRDLQRTLLQRKVGSKVELTVVREKKERAFSLVTQERPSSGRATDDKANARGQKAPDTFGLDLEPLTKQLAEKLGITAAQGAVVTSVQRGSTAERAGLRARDLIVEADKKPVRGPEDVRAALTDGTALLRIIRGKDSSSFLVLSRE
jgi:serine protease Do